MRSVAKPTNDHDATVVRGLAVPPTLTDLLERGRWKHPGDTVLRKVIPWFGAPLIFLSTVDQMRRESRSIDRFADDDRSSTLFRAKRASASDGPVELPWLDTERAFLIAVNRIPGDDVAVALDYRTDAAGPRVLASDFWSNPGQCAWRIVAPTFVSFADALGLFDAEPVLDFPPGSPEGPIVGWQP